jgi:hypothetical protein
MSLPIQLAPFHGKHVIYNVPENSQQLVGALGLKAPEGKLRLFVFDWKTVDADAQEQIREKSGQDDYCFFAVINGNPEAENLEEILEGKHQGFLMYAGDRANRIYLGDGGMETFTTKIDEFVEGLEARG